MRAVMMKGFDEFCDELEALYTLYPVQIDSPFHPADHYVRSCIEDEPMMSWWVQGLKKASPELHGFLTMTLMRIDEEGLLRDQSAN